MSDASDLGYYFEGKLGVFDVGKEDHFKPVLESFKKKLEEWPTEWKEAKSKSVFDKNDTFVRWELEPEIIPVINAEGDHLAGLFDPDSDADDSDDADDNGDNKKSQNEVSVENDDENEKKSLFGTFDLQMTIFASEKPSWADQGDAPFLVKYRVQDMKLRLDEFTKANEIHWKPPVTGELTGALVLEYEPISTGRFPTFNSEVVAAFAASVPTRSDSNERIPLASQSFAVYPANQEADFDQPAQCCIEVGLIFTELA